MLFHFLYFSQCVCLGIKRSTKLQISKSTPKGDISFFKNPFSRTTANGSFGLQSCFPVFVIVTNCKSRLWKFEWLGGLWDKNTPAGVFISLFLMETNCFQNFGCHFHFILHIMSDKAAFVNRALLCIQRYQGNLALSRWQRIKLHIYIYIYIYIYTATNKSVGLWYK